MNDHIEAQTWLKKLDDAEYESCWHSAAEYFRNGVALVEFVDKVKISRGGLGQIQSRELNKSQETEGLVGPSGKCLICEYKSVFSEVGEIGERLTLQQEDDGQWRAVGYYLI